MKNPVPILPPYKIIHGSCVRIFAELSNINEQLSNVPEVWKQTHGEDVTIVVADTGMPNHVDIPQLKALNYTTSATHNDVQGHSTHVTGVINAIPNNGIGIRGIASKSNVIHAKVLGDTGAGTLDGLLTMLERISETGVDILNMSLGFPPNIPTIRELEKACDKLAGQGVLIVCAAGNESANTSQPACYSSVISVASVNEKLRHSNFSNIGKVDFAAIGEDSFSCWLNNSYAALSGTSMATPIISAIAALIVSKHRMKKQKITRDDLIDHMRKIAFDIGPYGIDKLTGYGILKFPSGE